MKSIITDWKLWFVYNCEAFLAFWFLKKPGKSVSGVTTDLRWCISALQKKFLQMHKSGRCVQQSTVQCSAKQRWHGQSMALLPRMDKWTHTRVYVTKSAGSSQPGTSSWSCTVRCVRNYTQSHSLVSQLMVKRAPCYHQAITGSGIMLIAATQWIIFHLLNNIKGVIGQIAVQLFHCNFFHGLRHTYPGFLLSRKD